MNRQSDNYLQKRSRTLFPCWIEGYRQTKTKMFWYNLKYWNVYIFLEKIKYPHMNKCVTCSFGIRSTPKVPPNMDRHLYLVTLRDGTHFSEMHLQATSKNHMRRMNKGPGPLAGESGFLWVFPAIWSRGFQLSSLNTSIFYDQVPVAYPWKSSNGVLFPILKRKITTTTT